MRWGANGRMTTEWEQKNETMREPHKIHPSSLSSIASSLQTLPIPCWEIRDIPTPCRPVWDDQRSHRIHLTKRIAFISSNTWPNESHREHLTKRIAPHLIASIRTNESHLISSHCILTTRIATHLTKWIVTTSPNKVRLITHIWPNEPHFLHCTGQTNDIAISQFSPSLYAVPSDDLHTLVCSPTPPVGLKGRWGQRAECVTSKQTFGSIHISLQQFQIRTHLPHWQWDEEQIATQIEIYTDIQTGRQGHKGKNIYTDMSEEYTDIETGKKTKDRQTGRQTDRHIYRQRWWRRIGRFVLKKGQIRRKGCMEHVRDKDVTWLSISWTTGMICFVTLGMLWSVWLVGS